MRIYKSNTMVIDCIHSFAFRNKYDLQSNDIVRWIFDIIKKNQWGHFIKDNVVVDIVEGDVSDSTFENFHISAKTKNEEIHIDIHLSNDFSITDYNNIQYVLYEAVRHELEHIDKYNLGKRPDEKYVQLYNDLMKSNPIEKHVDMVSQYILSDVEMDSYVKSIMYAAKKQHRSVLEVIEQVINRAFFNNDAELMKQGMNNPKMLSIIEKTRQALRDKIKEYYPRVRERWF